MKIDKKEIARSSLIVTLLIFVVLVCQPLLDLEFKDKVRQMLGDFPLGFQVEVYIVLFTAALCLPLFFFMWHTMITVYYAKKSKSHQIHAGDRGGVLVLLNYLRYLLKSEGEEIKIRISKLITLAGLLYLIGIVVWWIWWSQSSGI